ncbi:MAG: hypothetical protein NWQ28_03315 [Nodularia sp. (in: cyanobacteria)]|nr:hypothetical protein [Nodularia sp. (in: cyanobacteria)]
MGIPNIEKVDFSEKELIILYNYIPRLIEKYAILVNLAPSYYTNGKQEVLFTEDTKGNYWVIATDYDVYWLFPITQLKGKFNTHVNETLNLLFEFNNYESSENREFTLKKPAKVYPASSWEGWILESTGFLDFNNSRLFSMETSNGKVNNSQLIQQNSIPQVSREEFDDFIHKSEWEINQLKVQVQQLTEAREQFKNEIQEIKDMYISLEHKLPAREENSSYSNHQVETTQEEKISNQNNSSSMPTKLNLHPEELRIVETYNSNPVLISQQAKQVSETTTSIEKRSQGINDTVVLEKQSQGHYWLVGKETLYLMPRRGFKINRSTVDTFKALFQFRGSKVPSKFKLIKPAQVAMIANSQTWQLTERGIIEFE